MTTQELHGIAHELGFWKGFVKTDRFLKGWAAPIPTPELNDLVKQFIHYNAPANARILDAGSGVVSILHGLRPDLNIVAADPLGELYALVFDYKRHGINAPLPVPAEELCELTHANHYDLVHCSNALDHTQDPYRAFSKLYSCVKPGGYLLIQGFTNEAVNENWQGFHQWNITLTENGRLDIQGRETGYLCGPVPEQHHLLTLPTGKEWFIYVARKGG